MPQPPGPPEPETRRNPDRESIWSIPATLKKLYFSLFSAQMTIAVIWLTQAALSDPNLKGPQAKILHIWENLAPIAISAATIALILTDGWKTTMVLGTWLEDELKKRHQRQINSAVSKAVDQTRAEEREKARQELLAESQKWETWNQNREAAEAAGEPFTEPPPSRLPPREPEHYY